MVRKATIREKRKKKMDIGQRIAARRIQQGISQIAVSRLTGLDPSYLSRIETGKVHPTVRTAMKISDALQLSLEDLVGPTPPEKRHQLCPVSHNGRCLLDLMELNTTGRKGATAESYSPRELRLLRRFTVVLRNSNPSTLKAFEVLFTQVVNGKRRAKS